MNRLEHIVDNMHKEANIFSGLANLAKQNIGASSGAILGGALGAYKGSQGPEGGLKGALLGGAQGAAGGAMIGYAGEKFSRSAFGKNSVGKQLKANTAQIDQQVADTLSSGQRAQGGMFKKIRDRMALRRTQGKQLRDISLQKQDIYEAVDAGLMDADKARAAVDKLNKSNIFAQRDALKQQRLYGTIGAGMLAYTGGKLVNEGMKSGQSADNQIVKNLQDKYRKTGKLDEREMAALTSRMTGSST